MEQVQGPSTAQVQPAQVQPAADQAVEAPKVVASGQSDQSTISSSNAGNEKSFFAVITDPFVAGVKYVAGKISAFFSYIASFFCGSSDAVKVKTTQTDELKELKAACEKAYDCILNDRDNWTATYDALPAGIQEALIRADLEDIVKSKIDTTQDEDAVAEEVEKRFNDETQKAERVDFIRNLKSGNLWDQNNFPGASYFAYNDRYVPSYLQHIIARLNADLESLEA